MRNKYQLYLLIRISININTSKPGTEPQLKSEPLKKKFSSLLWYEDELRGSLLHNITMAIVD